MEEEERGRRLDEHFLSLSPFSPLPPFPHSRPFPLGRQQQRASLQLVSSPNSPNQLKGAAEQLTSPSFL